MLKQPLWFTNVPTAADDVALIAFTSGTTGKPKGTMHFHRDVVAMCDCFPRSILKAHKDDIFCGTPPLAFTFGLGGMLCFPMRVGASSVLVEKHTPESLLETIERFKATVCFAAPVMYRGMAALLSDSASRFDLSSLKKCVSAGEALPDATRQMFKEATGIEIIDGIGSTEMIHIFISHAPEQVRRGATGYAIPGYQATVLDEEGRPCAPGKVGRLAVKGPTGCKYLADDRQADYVQNGWNVTGDAYLMDGDGYFFYQARTDDMIISAGYNIAGPEVEGALLAHPAVGECGVIGWPDEERGTIVKAYVVLKPGHEQSDEMKESTSGAREASHRSVQVPARYRIRRHAAAHRDREAAALQAEENCMMQILQPPDWARAKGFSNGIATSGKLVFIAGQVGWTGQGEWKEKSFAGQFRQTIQNILDVLAEARGKPEHIVRLTWYVLDRDEYLASLKEVGAAYRELMGKHYPTMAVVQVSGLVERNARLEIEATAVVPEK